MKNKIQNYLESRPKMKKFLLWLLISSQGSRPRLWVRLTLNRFFHQRGEKSLVKCRARLDTLPFNKFILGHYSVIESYTVVNNGVGDVVIGNNTFIGISNIIIGPVEIGNNVMTAQHVVLSGLNHQYEDITQPIRNQPVTTAKIVIEDDCWIGANAVITAGVRVGKHSVVAGGSVVTRDVPPFSVVGGNPARILKTYNTHTQKWEKAE